MNQNPSLNQVVVALPSPQEKRPPQIVNGNRAVSSAMAPSMAPLIFPEGETSPEQQRYVDPDGAKPLMELSYDKLVYSVGTKTGTFGVPGVREYCFMLKVS